MTRQLDFGFSGLVPARNPQPVEDRQRLRGQAAKILLRLQKGPALNTDLAEIALKYSGRISDLRAAGYEIEATNLGGGLWRYSLRGKSILAPRSA